MKTQKTLRRFEGNPMFIGREIEQRTHIDNDFVVKLENFNENTYSNFHRCHPVFEPFLTFSDLVWQPVQSKLNYPIQQFYLC